jgi:pyridoxine kinase
LGYGYTPELISHGVKLINAVLDPVMGDQGRLYVNDDVVPAYKKIIPFADLILPNQFEAEYALTQPANRNHTSHNHSTNISRVLSGIKITSLETLAEAITSIHRIYSVPHVIITSVQLFKLSHSKQTSTPPENFLTVIGSTTKSDGVPRLFRIDVPALDCFFSGTGDMFAALTVARLSEAVSDAGGNLRGTKSWVSPDAVAAVDLPLAKATVKVLSSMHSVLEKTLLSREAELAIEAPATDGEGAEAKEKREYLRRTKAAEVRLVRNTRDLRNPEILFEALDWRKEDLPLHLQ